MNSPKKKSLAKRVTNFKVVLRYLRESSKIINQGARLKDKLILLLYYTRIPVIIIKSLIFHKSFREIEEEKKHLVRQVTLKNKNGVLFCGNNIATIHTADENYEKNLYPWFELNAGIFIDVGAHIGKYTVKLARNSSNKVIAIEPEKNNFSFLEKNIALNKLKNTICINKGAYSAMTKLPFYFSGKGEGTHSILKQDENREEIFIPVDTLDNIVSQFGILQKINLIKIDAEGAEFEVLKGAKNILKNDHPSLIIEIWDDNADRFKKVTTLLSAYNYNIRQSYEDNYWFY